MTSISLATAKALIRRTITDPHYVPAVQRGAANTRTLAADMPESRCPQPHRLRPAEVATTIHGQLSNRLFPPNCFSGLLFPNREPEPTFQFCPFRFPIILGTDEQQLL